MPGKDGATDVGGGVWGAPVTVGQGAIKSGNAQALIPLYHSCCIDNTVFWIPVLAWDIGVFE
ncbi:hypothetical protein GCM10007880_10340 [Mesorhizobium amorphae]|nr:hypothetical protein GCM10007880_10340 [Mesorhizobium amorphae]